MNIESIGPLENQYPKPTNPIMENNNIEVIDLILLLNDIEDARNPAWLLPKLIVHPDGSGLLKATDLHEQPIMKGNETSFGESHLTFLNLEELIEKGQKLLHFFSTYRS